jgi:hypothetical protein
MIMYTEQAMSLASAASKFTFCTNGSGPVSIGILNELLPRDASTLLSLPLLRSPSLPSSASLQLLLLLLLRGEEALPTGEAVFPAEEAAGEQEEFV